MGALALALLLPLFVWNSAWQRALSRQVQALSEADPSGRQATLQWFGSVQRAAVTPLIASLGEQRGGLWEASVMTALTGMDRELVVPELMAGLDSPSSGVRHHCSVALAFLGPEVVPALVAALAQLTRVEGRAAAVWALAMMGPDASLARAALERATEDPAKLVKHTARFALHQLDDENDDYWNRIREARRQGLVLEREPASESTGEQDGATDPHADVGDGER